MKTKITAVIWASPNENRYSYRAVQMLKSRGHEVLPLGNRKGEIGNQEIVTDWPKLVENLDTVTLYVGPQHQPPLYDYIFELKPKRIIFNPGTENNELVELAREKGIETEYACTLVMLSVGNY